MKPCGPYTIPMLHRLVSIAVLLFTVVASVARADEFDPPPVASEFVGTVTGKVNWVPAHTSTWFMFWVETLKPEQGDAQKFEPLLNLPQGLKIAVQWDSGTPNAQQLDFVSKLKPGDRLTLRLVRASDGNGVRLSVKQPNASVPAPQSAPQSAAPVAPVPKDLQDLHTVQDPFLRSLLFEEFNGRPNGYFLFGATAKQTMDRLQLVAVQNAQATSERFNVSGQRFNDAVRVKVDRASEYWHVHLRADAPKTNKGDTLWLTFWARTPDPQDVTIRASVKHATENPADPQSGFPDGKSNIEIKLNRQWTQFVLPMTARHTDSTRFELYTGYQSGTVEIGGLGYLDFGAAMARTDLPQGRKAMNYPGRESSAAWRKAAQERIETLRKGDLTVRVLDETGKPVPDAQVRFEMKRHQFWFGVSIPPNHFPGHPDVTWGGTTKSLLTSPEPRGVAYRNAVQSNFNAGTVGGGWRQWEYEKQQQIDHINAMRALGIDRIKLHVLLYPREDQVPDRIRAIKDPMKVREEHLKFVRDHVTALKGLVSNYDVTNELFGSKFVESRFAGNDQAYIDYLADIYKLVKEIDPTVTTVYNECDLDGPGRARFEQLVSGIRSRGGQIDMVGIQGHVGALDGGPEAWLKLFDRIAAMGVKLQITEFDAKIGDVRTTASETLAADITRDFLTAAYSHPAMEGFIMWGFWDREHWLGDAPIYRTDWSLKPSGYVWRDMLFNQWWTDVTAKSNSAGVASTRGFLGDYVVTVTLNGKTLATKVMHDQPTGKSLDIVLK
jgi:GH35 family endo-1,4-beta-xylanase